MGRPNVGKSTLLNAIVGEPLAITSHKPQTTRDRITGVLTKDEAQLVLVDTPGLHEPRTRLGERMNREARGAIEGSDVVVFVTDVGKEPSARVHDGDLPLLASLPKVPTVLVLNKVDRVKTKDRLLPLLEAYEKAHPFVALVPLSARAREGTAGRKGIARLVEVIRELLPAGERAYEADALTDKPTSFFVAEAIREQILLKTEAEVPHGVAVVIERFDESGKTVKIDASIAVDKPSHKRILIGRGGAMLKEIGTAARARIEELVGRKVHLSLWIKVAPRWQESDAKLAELGYGGSS